MDRAPPRRVLLVLRFLQRQLRDGRQERGFLAQGHEFRAIDKTVRQPGEDRTVEEIGLKRDC